MFKTLTARLAVAAGMAITATAVTAAPIQIDTANASNGITYIYSTSIQGPITPCGGGSPSYCAFFGGTAPAGSVVVVAPNPTGVINGAPGGIAGSPFPGSYLDLTLSGGNTSLTLASGTITYPALTITIAGTTLVSTAPGAGMVFDLAPQATSVNGSGQAEFLVNLSPATAVDFSTLGAVVTGCTGPLCGLLGVLSLDMVRYRLFIDYDPTFTSFTGDFIGQTSTNSFIYATLNSGSPATLIPVPAAVWLMGSALGLMGWIRRKAAV